MMSERAKRLGAIAVFAVFGVAVASGCGGRAGQSSGDAGSSGPVDGALDAPMPPEAPDAALARDAGLPVDARPAVDAPPDAPVPPDAPAPQAPRLIAPLSMTAVTQQRPTLRWTLPDGVTAPVVDLCRDRACTTPLAIAVDLGDTGRTAVPHSALPTGWVFWRVRATSGSDTMFSATWQFWVGGSSASNPVDTSNGALLDINGDGFADLVVGAPLSFNEAGAVFVYFGSATASAADWNGASPPARIQLVGTGGGALGSAVASAGDVNGDGYADFLVGAVGGGNTGPVRLYLGSASPSVGSWSGPNAALRIDLAGPVPNNFGLGFSVAGAGDVNRDGYGDFVIGGGAGAGGAHVYFGSAAPSAADWDAASSPRRIDLINPGLEDGFGGAVAAPGDVNGDGYADILVGTRSGQFDDGRVYLYLGSATPGFTDWNRRSSTTRIEIDTPDGFEARWGTTLAGAGDVNGDGYADFAIGAELADAGTFSSETGTAHLYLGSATPGAAGWNGMVAGKRIDLVSPDGAQGLFGSAVASAGDVNGDGFTDFIVTAFLTGQGRGAAHVYLGGATLDPTSWNSFTHPSRLDLFNPSGPGAGFGRAAGSGGDVNGDGFPDFLVGAGAAAHLYLGLASPAVTSWNGDMPASRIDILGPGGQISGLGSAVARVDPRRRPAVGRRLP